MNDNRRANCVSFFTALSCFQLMLLSQNRFAPSFSSSMEKSEYKIKSELIPANKKNFFSHFHDFLLFDFK